MPVRGWLRVLEVILRDIKPLVHPCHLRADITIDRIRGMFSAMIPTFFTCSEIEELAA